MWQAIENYFDSYPAQKNVVKLLLELGLSVKNKKIYCGAVEVPALRVAEVAKVDRRVVNSTIATIEKKAELKTVFENLRPIPFFKDVAPWIGAGVVEITPTSASKTGIVAGVTKIIAAANLSVRQVATDDPTFSDSAKCYIITERPVPARLLKKIKAVPGVRAVTIY